MSHPAAAPQPPRFIIALGVDRARQARWPSAPPGAVVENFYDLEATPEGHQFGRSRWALVHDKYKGHLGRVFYFDTEPSFVEAARCRGFPYAYTNREWDDALLVLAERIASDAVERATARATSDAAAEAAAEITRLAGEVAELDDAPESYVRVLDSQSMIRAIQEEAARGPQMILPPARPPKWSASVSGKMRSLRRLVIEYELECHTGSVPPDPTTLLLESCGLADLSGTLVRGATLGSATHPPRGLRDTFCGDPVYGDLRWVAAKYDLAHVHRSLMDADVKILVKATIGLVAVTAVDTYVLIEAIEGEANAATVSAATTLLRASALVFEGAVPDTRVTRLIVLFVPADGRPARVLEVTRNNEDAALVLASGI